MTTAAIHDLSAQLRAELTASVQDTTQYPIRNSNLKQMTRSPAHAKHSILSEWEQTLSQRLGKGAHSLLLGGPSVLCCPTKQRRGKDYDAWVAKQQSDAIVLTSKEYDRAHRINEAVRANKLACQVLFVPGTVYEETIMWEQLGRSRRCTPDARTRDHLVDLKTTRDASPDRFRWDVAKYGYDLQAGDYALAIETTTGLKPRRCYIVAVETKPPYLCTVHLFTDGTIQRAQQKCRSLLEQLIECERTNTWAGYSSEILDLDIPDSNMELIFDDSEGDDDSSDSD